jgi:hypothetical protein
MAPPRTKATYTPAMIERALRLSHGLVSHAAARLHCQSSTLHRAIRKNKHLHGVLAEDGLIKLARQGNVAALIFPCKTLGQSRGFVERPSEKRFVPQTETRTVVSITSPDSAVYIAQLRGMRRRDEECPGEACPIEIVGDRDDYIRLLREQSHLAQGRPALKPEPPASPEVERLLREVIPSRCDEVEPGAGEGGSKDRLA